MQESFCPTAKRQKIFRRHDRMQVSQKGCGTYAIIYGTREEQIRSFLDAAVSGTNGRLYLSRNRLLPKCRQLRKRFFAADYGFYLRLYRGKCCFGICRWHFRVSILLGRRTAGGVVRIGAIAVCPFGGQADMSGCATATTYGGWACGGLMGCVISGAIRR